MDLLSQDHLPRREFLKLGAMAAAGGTLAMTALAQAKTGGGDPGSGIRDRSKSLKAGMASMQQEVLDTLTPKDYTHLINEVEGLSENQLRQHFKLYENYVNKTNMLHQAIAKADADMLSGANSAYSAFREMNVELTYISNGVVLHELYFGNLGQPSDPHAELKALITRDFGGWDNYLKHLVAVGKAMRGWAITGIDLRDGHLRNYGLDAHNVGSPVDVYPLMVLDVYEHAYMIDYGTDRGKYLDAFVQHVNWQVVYDRLLFGVHHLMNGPSATA